MSFLSRGVVSGAILLAAAACAASSEKVANPGDPFEFAGKNCSGTFYAAGNSGKITLTIEAVASDGLILGKVKEVRPNKANFDLPHSFVGTHIGNVAEVKTPYGRMKFLFRGDGTMIGNAFVTESGTRVEFDNLTCVPTATEEAATS